MSAATSASSTYDSSVLRVLKGLLPLVYLCSLASGAVLFFGATLWRESFLVLLPDSANTAVNTEVASTSLRGVCFTVNNLSQCTGEAYRITNMERWQFNATRDGWAIVGEGQSAFTPLPLFYPVLTGASAATHYAVKCWHVLGCLPMLLFRILMATGAIAGVTDPSGQLGYEDGILFQLTAAVVENFFFSLSLWSLISGCAQLVGVNAHFRLCEGCTLLHHRCEATSMAVYLHVAILVLNCAGVLIAYAAWKAAVSMPSQTLVVVRNTATSKVQ